MGDAKTKRNTQGIKMCELKTMQHEEKANEPTF